MKLDSKWNESILDTASIVLGLVVPIFLQGTIQSVAVLLAVPIAIVVVVTAYLLKKYRISRYEGYRKLVIKSARGLIGALAGLLFTISYVLIVQFSTLGIRWAAFGVFLAALAFGFVF